MRLGKRQEENEGIRLGIEFGLHSNSVEVRLGTELRLWQGQS